MNIVNFGGDGVGVVVNGNFGYSFQFRKLDVGFDRANRFLTPSRVELIGKRSILRLETTTNR